MFDFGQNSARTITQSFVAVVVKPIVPLLYELAHLSVRSSFVGIVFGGECFYLSKAVPASLRIAGCAMFVSSDDDADDDDVLACLSPLTGIKLLAAGLWKPAESERLLIQRTQRLDNKRFPFTVK